MGIECDYSFDALYQAAFGKKIPKKEKRKFQSLSQDEINTLVSRWAKKAGWDTTEKKGTDGNNFLSFHPS